MGNEEFKAAFDNPPPGTEDIAFKYRQAIAKRQAVEKKIGEIQSALGQAQAEFHRAAGYEHALHDLFREALSKHGERS